MEGSSQNENRLELPVELWEKIVDQLPSPEPKIFPSVRIWKSSKKKWTCIVSRGCSKEEAEIVAGRWWIDFEKVGSNMYYPQFDCGYEHVRDIIASSLTLGYTDESNIADSRGCMGPTRNFFFLIRRK